MMKTLFKTLAAVSLFALAGTALAVPIKGSIAFGTAVGASWSPVMADLTTPTSTALADGVLFNANGAGDDGIVTAAFGDWSGTAGTGVDFNDHVFDPLAAGTNLWSFSTGGVNYSFTMNTSTILAQSASTISLAGGGFASIDGFDNTFGDWSLTLNQNGAAFSFSSSAAPEPSIVALLGIGLLGLGAARRFKKSA